MRFQHSTSIMSGGLLLGLLDLPGPSGHPEAPDPPARPDRQALPAHPGHLALTAR